MFGKALYYPTIDIRDEDWLKTAYLFWDEISTIVPSSMVGNAYNNYTTQYLEGEGFLNPILVTPDDKAVKCLIKEVRDFAMTDEGMACLNQRLPDGVYSNPYDDERSQFYLHHDKLPYEIQELVADKIGEDGWARVSENFADYYMTLLANRIASQKSLALLTNLSPLESLSTSVSVTKYNTPFSIAGKDGEAIGRCVLMKMIIDGLTISPLTSIDDLRIFKERHIDELRSFRNGMEEISKMELPPDITLEGIEQKAEDIYNNKVLLAYQNLQKSLKGAGIRYIIGGTAALAFTDISTGFNELLVNLSSQLRFAIGAGAILAYQGYQDVKGRKAKKEDNTMSYLLSINKELVR